MSRKRILFIFGTRPEAIKLLPVVNVMRLGKEFTPIVCVTAQHRQMLDQVLSVFDVKPDVDLNLMSENQELTDLTSKILSSLSKLIDDIHPDMILVQGDTTTTFIAALSAFYHQIPIGHIEAGLRTYNKYSPFPEEMNRVITSHLADLNFAPTEIAYQNLIREGIPKNTIYITGNTVIDALMYITKKLPQKSKSPKSKIILVTGHRRENFGSRLREICLAIKDIAHENPDFQIIYPVHLNPNVKKPVNKLLGNIKNIKLIEPLNYFEFINLMRRCYLILTDSGGIQEEAPTFGKPVLVMRDQTERPEGLKSGTSILVGTDKEKIKLVVKKLITDQKYYLEISKKKNPFGDGNSAKRILKILIEFFNN